MSRCAFAVVLFSLLASTPTAQASPEGSDGTDVVNVQLAAAMWTERSSSRTTVYYVEAQRYSGPLTGTQSYARASIERCPPEGSCSLVRGDTRYRRIPNEDFEFDTALRAAELIFDDGRYVHNVKWTGAFPAVAGAWPAIGCAAIVPVAVARFADAEALLFGRRFSYGAINLSTAGVQTPYGDGVAYLGGAPAVTIDPEDYPDELCTADER